jgi:signal transduction histidine kinase
VRVLSHEINNTLAPVKSIAASLLRRVRAARARAAAGAAGADGAALTTSGTMAAATLSAAAPPVGAPVGVAPGTSDDDFTHGLAVIAERADALARFIGAYARLSRLPPPTKGPVDVGTWVRRVAALERRVTVHVAEGTTLVVQADADQLDQLLINVVRNAADAAIETAGAAGRGGTVRVAWRATPAQLVVTVDDDGPGLTDTANLFVPFYSTKPEGSGIGLALCRQIAEAHGGTITLANRDDARGCRATLVLPR